MDFYSVDTFEPARSVGYQVKRIHYDMVALLEPLFADAEISYSQWAALISVHFGNSDSCATLSRDIGHDMGATSRMIATLEERGLVERSRNAGDRRIVNLALTPAGRTLALSYRDRLVACWNEWLAGWSADEVTVLIAGLQRLRATMDAAREGQA